MELPTLVFTATRPPIAITARCCAAAVLALVWPALFGQTMNPASSAKPVFLSGSVQLNDGTPPPEPVVIQRICASVMRNEAVTDRKGRFSFQVGGGQSAFLDASLDSSGNNRSGLTQYQVQEGVKNTSEMFSASSVVGCDLRAQMPGYRSDVLHLDKIGLLEKGDVGTIVLHRLGNVQGLTVSATTVAAPKESAKAYEQGLKEVGKRHFDKARADFESAVKGYPNYAVAWVGLGLACEHMNDPTAALRAYTEASRADAKLLTPYERLTVLSDRNQQWGDSAKYSAEWIRLDPVDFPNAYLLNAVANVRLNKLDEAEHSAREGLRLDKEGRFPRIRFVLGYILAARNELAEAVGFFHDYLRMEPNGSEAGALRTQLPSLEQAAAAARKP
jgi:tetratricopeptide (TPR) repeat protein